MKSDCIIHKASKHVISEDFLKSQKPDARLLQQNSIHIKNLKECIQIEIGESKNVNLYKG